MENLLNCLPSTARATFYRTAKGAELDLLIEFSPSVRWGIEIKRSLGYPNPGSGFYTACKDAGVTRQIVLYPGTETYRIHEATEVMPLQALLQDPMLAGGQD